VKADLFNPVAPADLPRRPTAAEALELHGFTWERLEKLARRALHDRMRRRRITLDADRYQEALDLYVEVGARWAIAYRPELARGVTFATSCYRRMYPRLTDYLRARHGDERHGRPIMETPAERLPDGELLDEHTFTQAVSAVSAHLPRRARWTLERLGRPMAEDGLTLQAAAVRAGVTVEEAEELLEELGWRLGRRADREPDRARDDFALLEAFA
jgi:hypothetical protein